MTEFALSTNGADIRATDRMGIVDATYLYAAAVDTLGCNPRAGSGPDEALADSLVHMSGALTPDAQLRLFLAGPEGPWQPMGDGGPAGAVDAVRAYFTAYGYVGTQHSVGNPRIAFTGEDAAVGTSQIPCFHWLADGRMLLAPVSYHDHFLRQDGIWKIWKRDVFAMRFWVVTGYEPDPLDPTMAPPA